MMFRSDLNLSTFTQQILRSSSIVPLSKTWLLDDAAHPAVAAAFEEMTMGALNPLHSKLVPFGGRRTAPHVCVIERKPHVRTFLSDMLENIGFVPHQCANKVELRESITAVLPELAVFGTLSSEAELKTALSNLAVDRYAGRVMLFGGRASATLLDLHEYGEGLGLTMLPPLLTPFRDSDLLDSLAVFLPIQPPPRIEIEADEAVSNDWVEVWYRPKIDLQALTVIGAHAELRVRHPQWGLLTPSSFLPSTADPKSLTLVGSVTARVMTDWRRFLASRHAFELTLPLPTQALEDSQVLERLCIDMPDESALAQLIIEVPAVELSRESIRSAMKKLAPFNVGVAIDSATTEGPWSTLSGSGFPLAEVQVATGLVTDAAAGDHEAAKSCARIVQLGKKMGARSAAKGIDTPAVLKTARDMGVELGTGDLFGKAMDVQRFAKAVLRQQPTS